MKTSTWTVDKIKEEFKLICDQLGEVPTSHDLRKIGKRKLSYAINSHLLSIYLHA